MSNPGTPSDLVQDDEIMTVDELAALLRMNRKSVYAAIKRHEIPGIRKIGGVLRASRSAVLAWLASGQGNVSRSPRGAR